MKGCSNGKCASQTGGCGCGLMSGGSKRAQTGGAWSMWNPISGGEFYKLNAYGEQADRILEPTRTTLGSAKFGGGWYSRRKGRNVGKSKGRTIRSKKGLQKGGSGSTGSIVQELMNAKGDLSDMIGNVYTSYKGLDPLPSSAVYRDQYSRIA